MTANAGEGVAAKTVKRTYTMKDGSHIIKTLTVSKSIAEDDDPNDTFTHH